MKYIFWLIKFLIISYILAGIILYVFQRRFLYFSPKGAEEVGEKNIEINNHGIVLRGWIINKGKKNAILYYGGNAERIEYNIPFFMEIFKDYTVYLISYRGYGLSDGSPAETDLCNDAVFIYDEIKDKHDRISLIGRSLGCGVATYVASNRSVDKLVLITPFDSIVNVAKQIFWMYPISLLLKDKYEIDRLVDKISAKTKTLIIVAGDDEVIPRKRTDALISMFNPNILTVKIINGATHNTISFYPQFSEDMIEFMSKDGK